MNLATPELAAALSTMLDKIDATLRESGYQGEPIAMYLAGGLAVNYYCGTRFTTDVDASFSRRVALNYRDLVVDFRRRWQGQPNLLRHVLFSDARPDARGLRGRCDRMDWYRQRASACQPVDIAVSKLGRFEGHDLEDILALAARSYFTLDQFRERAEVAASYFVGEVRRLRTTIEIVCRHIAELDPPPNSSSRPPG